MKIKKGRIKKADIFLIGGALIAALFMFFLYTLFYTGTGETAVVYYDGKEIGRYPLSQDGDYILHGTNTIRIEKGVVDMIHAECKNQLCVNQRPIQNVGEQIVCLPEKIVVQIEGTNPDDKTGSVDSIVY